MKIDVHMIVLPGDVGSAWHTAQMASLDCQRDHINLEIVDGAAHGTHIGRSRAEGFRRGTSSHVCYVDPDDWCDAEIFRLLVATAVANPDADAVYSYDMIVDRDGRHVRKRDGFGHAMAFRRDRLRYDLLEAAELGSEAWMKDELSRIVLPVIGYYYREYPDSPARRNHQYVRRVTSSPGPAARARRPVR